MTYLVSVLHILTDNTATVAVILGNMLVLFCFLRPRWKWWLYPVLLGITLLALPLVGRCYFSFFGTSISYSILLASLGYYNIILIFIAFHEGFFETIILTFTLAILNRWIVFCGYVIHMTLISAIVENIDISMSLTLVIVLIYSIISLVCWFLLKDKGRQLIHTKLPRHNSRVLAGISVSAKLIIDLCSDYAFELNPYSDIQIIWSMIALCTFVLAVLGLYLYSTVTTQNRLELKATASRLVFEKEAQQRYYESQLQNQEELRKMKHDIKGHLTTISQLLADDNKEAAEKYLANLMKYNENHQKKLYSDNPYINAVVTNYTRAFTNNSITFEITIEPVSLESHQVEICLALNNALQNALEASLRMPPNKRYVKLQVKEKQNRILFRVTNSFDGKLVMKDGLPISTKQDSDHGFGLTSIRSAAESLGGFMVFNIEGNMFLLDVAM